MSTGIDAATLHRDALIIDGMIWDTDGDTREFRGANVAAINVTIQSSGVESDFETSCDDITRWLIFVNRNSERWTLVLAADDILAARASGRVGMIVGWQNARALGDRLDRLVLFHRLGLRITQPTYNKRTFLADGCLEPGNAGLSAPGRAAVRRMNEVGIALDLSHSSDRAPLDAAEVTSKPILITHVGAKGVTDWQRNKNDEAIEAVASTGGVIGVSLYGPIVWNGDARRRPTLDDYGATSITSSIWWVRITSGWVRSSTRRSIAWRTAPGSTRRKTTSTRRLPPTARRSGVPTFTATRPAARRSPTTRTSPRCW
jgi:membrane dipeptidase